MRSTAGPHSEQAQPDAAPPCATGPAPVSRHIDAAEVDDITNKGWRMMGLSLCFAVVSAFFPPREPEPDAVAAAAQVRPAPAPPEAVTAVVQSPPASERVAAPPLPGMATELAPAPQDR